MRRPRRPALRRAFLAASALLLLAAPAGTAEPVKSLLEVRQENVVLQQWDLSCGAAALATILNYQHGDEISEREVAMGLIRRPEYIRFPQLVQIRQGFSLLDMKRFVETRGYRGLGYGGLTFAELVELAPAIVPVGFRGYNHFVVFRGIARDRVLIADPAYGNTTMPVARFEAGWIDYPELGRIAFVVEAPDAAPSENRLRPRPRDFLTFN